MHSRASNQQTFGKRHAPTLRRWENVDHVTAFSLCFIQSTKHLFLPLLTLTVHLSQDYYRSGRMLVKMAEAIGRLVLAGRELTTLAG